MLVNINQSEFCEYGIIKAAFSLAASELLFDHLESEQQGETHHPGDIAAVWCEYTEGELINSFGYLLDEDEDEDEDEVITYLLEAVKETTTIIPVKVREYLKSGNVLETVTYLILDF